MTIPGSSAGNVQPEKRFGAAICGETSGIGKGQLVRRAFATELSSGVADGVTIMLCSDPSHIPCGVAVEKAAVNANIRYQSGGFCDYLNTEGNVGQGDLLCSCILPGVATGVYPSRLRALGFEDVTYLSFGIALDDDSGAILSAAWLYCQG